MSGCHFWFAVSHYCLPEAQSSDKCLVKRGLQEGLTWPHSPDLSPACSGTTPNSSIELEKNHKKITASLPLSPCFLLQLRLQFQGWTKRKTREHTCPRLTRALCATQRDPPWTITQHSSPALSTALPGSSYPHSIPTNPTTTVPQSWTLTYASSRFMEQAGWASPLFGFPGHS